MSISRFCAIVNTHSSYHDILDVFLRCYQRYAKGIKLFVFSNECYDGIKSAQAEFIKYSEDNFRDQYLNCLRQIPYEYVLTFNDDYFLIANPGYSEINYCVSILEKSTYSQIRFVRGSNMALEPIFHNLYPLNSSEPYFFSQTLTLWKRASLIKVFEAVAPSGIARKKREPQFEVLANSACEQLGLTGLVYYENEKKVGSAHYECRIFPHIVSAIVDGLWNVKEYAVELRCIERELDLKLNSMRNPNMFKKICRLFLS